MKTLSRLISMTAVAAASTFALGAPLAMADEADGAAKPQPITLSAGQSVETEAGSAAAGDTINLGGSRCTLGFIFTGQDNTSGNKALTAGHCGEIGTEVSVNKIKVGKIVAGESPAEGMLIPAGSTKGDWAVIDLYENVRPEPKGVLEGGRAIAENTVATEQAMVPGARVCTKGSSTGENCGEILSLDDKGYVTTNIYRFQGDSGGPLYFESNGAAAGVLSSTPFLDFGSLGSTGDSTSRYYRADLAVAPERGNLKNIIRYNGSGADTAARGAAVAATLPSAFVGS